jgi:phage terminase small subunit
MSTKKTAELRHRLGDPANGKHPTSRAQAPDFVPAKGLSGKAPADLTDEGKELWQTVTENAEWLTQSDKPGLVLLCRTYEKVLVAFANPKELSPAATGLLKVYQSLLDDYGLTPHSRITLGLAVAETKSKLDAFRAGE